MLTLHTGTYKTSLCTSAPPKFLSLHGKYINRGKNEVNGQSSNLLADIASY